MLASTQNRLFDFLAQGILALGLVMVLLPVYLMITTASHAPHQILEQGVPWLPGGRLWENLIAVWRDTNLPRQLFNSFWVTLIVVVGKLTLASLTAFAVVYFRVHYRQLIFWAIFLTLMLPLEVRIVPTYAVAANVLAPFDRLFEWLSGLELNLQWNVLNSYAGLSLPLIATATGTFLFRQFFQTVPRELAEAARMDGASPLRFFVDILVPLSKTNFAALATMLFISSWNQYLWPLMITTDETMYTAAVGVTHLLPNPATETPAWNETMAGALIIIVPPLLVVALMQRWFIKGLISGIK